MGKTLITPERLRVWWAHKQGLLEPLDDSTPAGELARAGWARSVGGVGPYLALQARGRHSREAIDAAVAAREIHELPSARACTYVVPASDYALALTVAAAAGNGDMKAALKLGVTEKEVDASMRRRARRSQGRSRRPGRDPGGRRGQSAQSWAGRPEKGDVVHAAPRVGPAATHGAKSGRVPTNGRLDQQRYRYCALESEAR